MRAWRGVVAVGLGACVLAVTISAAGFGSGASGSLSARPAEGSNRGTPPRNMPVAEVDRRLTRLDPLTLEPRGPSVELPEYHDNWSFSPSGSLVALGMGSPGTPTCGAGLCIVDVDSMQLAYDIDAPVAVQAIGWISPRRIAAVTQLGLVFVVDPVTGEVVSERNFAVETILPRSALAAGNFVTLVGGRFLRLVAVDAQGDIRVARLGGLGGGQSDPRSAGVTVDPKSKRAFVFASGPRAAEIDLRTMRVRYHRLRQGFSSASERPCATWLGHGRAVVYGETVRVVDTRNWTAESLGSADQAVVADRRLLTFSSRFSDSRKGTGLRVYSLDGKRLVAHRFGNRRLDVQVADKYGYALDPRSVRIVRARDGEVVHQGERSRSGFTQILDARSGSENCE